MLALTGCSGPQSALDAAGHGAELTVHLLAWMAAGATLIWAFVIGLAVYGMRRRREPLSERAGTLLTIGGGVVLPVIVLFMLLVFGLRLMPALTAPGDDGLRVEVTGEQFWWRVRYEPAAGPAIVSANEIRLPVGARTELELTSADVIHSLWIPSLGGKMDMIPGRTTRLVLEPTRTGVFRGTCAEFCGASHALMALDVVVMEPEAFDAWLEKQAAPAESPAGVLATRGQTLFRDSGCGACHRVAGTPATGVIGPDLTHVGGRSSLAAGTLPSDVDAFARWIGHTETLKPDVNMPAFDMLSEEERTAIGHYLAGLK